MYRQAVITVIWLLLCGAAVQDFVIAAAPLPRAHAHNDYLHERPLLDALEHGFCSVEADIFLTPDGLLVAHEAKSIRGGRTLQALYLDPLRRRALANGGRIYRDGPAFYLLVDVKTEAEATYAALDKVLAGYTDILSVTENGKTKEGAVTIILSGNRATAEVSKQSKRYVAIDGRLEDLKAGAPANLVPWISANWTLAFKWNGEGPFPPTEKQKLAEIVREAHEQQRKLRFWATPERAAMWSELVAAGVDLINTDKLEQLQQFLQAKP